MQTIFWHSNNPQLELDRPGLDQSKETQSKTNLADISIGPRQQTQKQTRTND